MTPLEELEDLAKDCEVNGSEKYADSQLWLSVAYRIRYAARRLADPLPTPPIPANSL